MLKTNNKSKSNRLWWSLPLLLLAAAAIVLLPVWLIQPFKAQTPSALSLSYALRSWSPLLTILLAVLTVVSAVWLWRGSRWFGRMLLVLSCVIVFGCTWLARQNHFEWMFNPLAQAQYAKAQEADFVDGKDMVLAVGINGESVAYPVRQMAYHHIAQDVVGGVPLVATY